MQTPDFIRLRISREHYRVLESLRNALNQNSISATTEWIISRNAERELRNVESISHEDKD
jgi:hypothetical protein